jgi:hypothetical protein
MLARELIAIVREDFLDDVSDAVQPQDDLYRWSTAFLLREAGNAQREACYRQDLRHLFDDSTPEICEIALVEGQRAYPLDPRILRIDTALLLGSGNPVVPLVHLSRARIEQTRPAWRDGLAGAARRFYIQGRALCLDPPPALAQVGSTLSLSVWREPLTSPGLESPLEWIESPEKLGHWMAHRAFIRPYPSTFDAELAKYHFAQFETAFGREVLAAARAELLAYPAEVSFYPLRSPGAGLALGCGDFDRGD